MGAAACIEFALGVSVPLLVAADAPAKAMYESDVILNEFADSRKLGGKGYYHTDFLFEQDEFQELVMDGRAALGLPLTEALEWCGLDTRRPQKRKRKRCNEQEALFALAALQKTDKVLDFGCGVGTFAMTLSTHASDFIRQQQDICSGRGWCQHSSAAGGSGTAIAVE
eukprot:TRINITY_DN64581_c0_g1_i2.p1 TRINITY_DN64581_c0_g1~~TRINITY_DN64581_c0_g1_i2.p1  ORF type:complete len:168 (+),score=40.46 TRINITY_DN64581_c0_g1_i2:100-603(+)